jgi:hypothetical protein
MLGRLTEVITRKNQYRNFSHVTSEIQRRVHQPSLTFVRCAVLFESRHESRLEVAAINLTNLTTKFWVVDHDPTVGLRIRPARGITR